MLSHCYRGQDGDASQQVRAEIANRKFSAQTYQQWHPSRYEGYVQGNEKEISVDAGKVTEDQVGQNAGYGQKSYVSLTQLRPGALRPLPRRRPRTTCQLGG